MKKLLSPDRIKVISFDADDTLWENEPYFRETEQKFGELMHGYKSVKESVDHLLTVEFRNIPRYGYGIKGFTLSMMETALEIMGNDLNHKTVQQVLDLGKSMLQAPVIIIEGIEETLQALQKDFKLVMATKGDLVDQEKKLEQSGLASYFHHIEIMSEKHVKDYQKLIKHLDIHPSEFMMVGNSLKSDIVPVLELGGSAIHIPFRTTWIFEQIDGEIINENFREIKHHTDLLQYR